MRRCRVLLVVPVLALAAAAGGPAVDGSAPRGETPPCSGALWFVADPDTIVASADLAWRYTLRLWEDHQRDTLFVDSLTAIVSDGGPGETRAEKTTRISLTRLLSRTTVAPGETLTVRPMMTAAAEHAVLLFEARGHSRCPDAPNIVSSWSISGHAVAVPGPASQAYPSRFVRVNGRRVEYILLGPAAGNASAGNGRSAERGGPALLLVHGHGGQARAMLRMGLQLAQKGYTVALASQPGYGLSDGPADFMGPRTIDALEAVLDVLEKTPGVDRTRVGAWGVSRGATAVTLLAERRPELGAVVAQSGVYDLWAGYRGTHVPGIPETIVAEAGRDSSAWRARSAITAIDRLRSPILVMHGGRDRNVPFEQARLFASALAARGAAVDTLFFPAAEHSLPRAEANDAALAFLARHLGATSGGAEPHAERR